MLHLILAALWMFQLAQQATPVKPAPPIEVNDWEADEHRIGDRWLYLRVSTTRAQRGYVDNIFFDVIVDPTGAVVSAAARGTTTRTEEGIAKAPPDALQEAESLVRALH